MWVNWQPASNCMNRQRSFPGASAERMEWGMPPTSWKRSPLPRCRCNTVIPIVLKSSSFPKHHLRSEEHTSELQSLMRISYAVFCLKKKKHKHNYKSIKTMIQHI